MNEERQFQELLRLHRESCDGLHQLCHMMEDQRSRLLQHIELAQGDGLWQNACLSGEQTLKQLFAAMQAWEAMLAEQEQLLHELEKRNRCIPPQF